MYMNMFEELAAVLGKDASLKLIGKFGNTVLYIPKMDGIQGPFREVEKIKYLYFEGYDIMFIGRTLGVTVEAIIDVLEVILTTEDRAHGLVTSKQE